MNDITAPIPNASSAACKRGRHRSIYYIIIAPGKQASHGERVHILRLAANEKDLLLA